MKIDVFDKPIFSVAAKIGDLNKRQEIDVHQKVARD